VHGRLITALLGLLIVAGAAAAHRPPGVRIVLGPLPSALDGIRIEVHETIAPQLVLANPTARVVEVLDEYDVAFLRIGPRGVEGNVASPAWWTSLGPATPVPAAASHDAEPRWAAARPEPSYGWFDPRLDPVDGHVHGGAWVVPLRVDGARVLLAGTFERTPPSDGAYAARLTSAPEPAAGVRVRLLPGPNAGLLVENGSRHVVTILDEDGEPFLRVGPSAIEANARSETWRRSGRAGTAVDDAPLREPSWVRVGTGGRYGWVDPRLAPPPTAAVGDVRRWQIPVLVGDVPVPLHGEIAWTRGRASGR